jgi:uncharacterized protein (TIGR03382 family)
VSERFGVRTSFFLNGCVITGTVFVVWLGWLRRRRRERLAYDLPLPAVE